MRYRPVALLAAVCLLVPVFLFADATPAKTKSPAQVRSELAAFFAHLGDKSPLGDMSRSPQALQEINKRIASMSDAEVAEFQKMMTEVPDWQKAPQEITKMMPDGTLQKIKATSAEFAARAPAAEKTRDDVGTIAAVLKMLPDAKLQELGIQRPMLDSLQTAVGQLSPVQSGVLEQKLSTSKAWQVNSAAAIDGMPPALQKGAAALAKHGPLTKDDVKELEKFRSDVIALLYRVNGWPEATKKTLNVDDLGANIVQFDKASPELVFMLRAQMPDGTLQRLTDAVGIMDRVANLSDSDKQGLEKFRGDLENLVAKGDQSAAARQKVDALSPAELMILKDSWSDTTPLYLSAMSDPGLQQRLQAVRQPNPDPAIVASLEEFRANTLGYLDTLGGSVDAKQIATARDAVAHAPLAKLELLRTATTATRDVAPSTFVKAATDLSLNCVVGLGSIDLGALGSFSLGSIDFNWICGPIQNAINAVAGEISSAVNAATTFLTNTINTVQNALQSAINAVTNTVDTLVNGIISTVNTIWNFVQTIPNLVWQALQSAINAFLDINLGGGLTIRTLISGGISQVVPALQNALNLGESFWNSLNDSLPLLPCPPAGFSTPFGTVGTDEAVVKYNRYHFFLDKIVGMIPSDAISLEVKIPAEVLYSAWDYLGVCLQDAANAAQSAQQDARYTNVTTLLGNLSNQGASNTTLLSQQLTVAFGNLTNLTNTSTANLTSLINTTGTSLTNLINQKTSDQRKLDLQLQIELNLNAGQGNALAMFQLPQANGGYLEMARDIVNNAINNMLAAGQSVGQAQQFFANGVSLMSSGKFKSAYDQFQKAYREATKTN